VGPDLVETSSAASYPFGGNTEPVPEEFFAIRAKTPNADVVY